MTDIQHTSNDPKPRRMRYLLGIATGFIVLSLADRLIWEALRVPKETLASLTSKDWYQLLRQVGFLPTWIIIAAATCAAARYTSRRNWWFEGTAIALSATLTGAAAELLKVIVMRHRPGEDGVYRFAWLLDHFDKGPGFGMPSSHAAVAFGGSYAVSYLYRGSCWVMLPLAAGCGLTRMLAGAHFATDVYVAAVLGWLISKALVATRARIDRRSTDTV